MRKGSQDKQASHRSLHSGGGRQQRETRRHQGSQHMYLPGRTEPQPSPPGTGLRGIFAMCAGESPKQRSRQRERKSMDTRRGVLQGLHPLPFFFF